MDVRTDALSDEEDDDDTPEEGSEEEIILIRMTNPNPIPTTLPPQLCYTSAHPVCGEKSRCVRAFSTSCAELAAMRAEEAEANRLLQPSRRTRRRACSAASVRTQNACCPVLRTRFLPPSKRFDFGGAVAFTTRTTADAFTRRGGGSASPPRRRPRAARWALCFNTGGAHLDANPAVGEALASTGGSEPTRFASAFGASSAKCRSGPQ